LVFDVDGTTPRRTPADPISLVLGKTPEVVGSVAAVQQYKLRATKIRELKPCSFNKLCYETGSNLRMLL